MSEASIIQLAQCCWIKGRFDSFIDTWQLPCPIVPHTQIPNDCSCIIIPDTSEQGQNYLEWVVHQRILGKTFAAIILGYLPLDIMHLKYPFLADSTMQLYYLSLVSSDKSQLIDLLNRCQALAQDQLRQFVTGYADLTQHWQHWLHDWKKQWEQVKHTPGLDRFELQKFWQGFDTTIDLWAEQELKAQWQILSGKLDHTSTAEDALLHLDQLQKQIIPNSQIQIQFSELEPFIQQEPHPEYLNLLIVNDDDTIRERLKNTLSFKGYNVSECDDIESAKTKLSQKQGQKQDAIILLDWYFTNKNSQPITANTLAELAVKQQLIVIINSSSALDSNHLPSGVINLSGEHSTNADIIHGVIQRRLFQTQKINSGHSKQISTLLLFKACLSDLEYFCKLWQAVIEDRCVLQTKLTGILDKHQALEPIQKNILEEMNTILGLVKAPEIYSDISRLKDVFPLIEIMRNWRAQAKSGSLFNCLHSTLQQRGDFFGDLRFQVHSRLTGLFKPQSVLDKIKKLCDPNVTLSDVQDLLTVLQEHLQNVNVAELPKRGMSQMLSNSVTYWVIENDSIWQERLKELIQTYHHYLYPQRPCQIQSFDFDASKPGADTWQALTEAIAQYKKTLQNPSVIEKPAIVVFCDLGLPDPQAYNTPDNINRNNGLELLCQLREAGLTCVVISTLANIHRDHLSAYACGVSHYLLKSSDYLRVDLPKVLQQILSTKHSLQFDESNQTVILNQTIPLGLTPQTYRLLNCLVNLTDNFKENSIDDIYGMFKDSYSAEIPEIWQQTEQHLDAKVAELSFLIEPFLNQNPAVRDASKLCKHLPFLVNQWNERRKKNSAGEVLRGLQKEKLTDLNNLIAIIKCVFATKSSAEAMDQVLSLPNSSTGATSFMFIYSLIHTLRKQITESAQSHGFQIGLQEIIQTNLNTNPAQYRLNAEVCFQTSKNSRKKNWRILIIEDNPDTLKILSEWSQQMDFEIHCAADFEQAQKALELFKPDIVSLDLQIPESAKKPANVEHGLTLLQQIRQNYPHIKMMLPSLYAHHDHIIRQAQLAGLTPVYLIPKSEHWRESVLYTLLRIRYSLETDTLTLPIFNPPLITLKSKLKNRSQPLMFELNGIKQTFIPNTHQFKILQYLFQRPLQNIPRASLMRIVEPNKKKALTDAISNINKRIPNLIESIGSKKEENDYRLNAIVWRD